MIILRVNELIIINTSFYTILHCIQMQTTDYLLQLIDETCYF